MLGSSKLVLLPNLTAQSYLLAVSGGSRVDCPLLSRSLLMPLALLLRPFMCCSSNCFFISFSLLRCHGSTCTTIFRFLLMVHCCQHRQRPDLDHQTQSAQNCGKHLSLSMALAFSFDSSFQSVPSLARSLFDIFCK